MYVEIREFKFDESDKHIINLASKLLAGNRHKKTLKITIDNHIFFIRQQISRREILIITIPSSDIQNLDSTELFNIGFIKTPLGEFRYHIETWKTDADSLTKFIGNLLSHLYGATKNSILNLELNEVYTPLTTKSAFIAAALIILLVPFIFVYFEIDPFHFVYLLFGGSRSPFISGLVVLAISLFGGILLYTIGKGTVKYWTNRKKQE